MPTSRGPEHVKTHVLAWAMEEGEVKVISQAKVPGVQEGFDPE